MAGRKRKRGEKTRVKDVAERLSVGFRAVPKSTFAGGRKEKEMRLVVGHLNIEGVSGDLTPMYRWLDKIGMDVVALTEMWLSRNRDIFPAPADRGWKAWHERARDGSHDYVLESSDGVTILVRDYLAGHVSQKVERLDNYGIAIRLDVPHAKEKLLLIGTYNPPRECDEDGVRKDRVFLSGSET